MRWPVDPSGLSLNRFDLFGDRVMKPNAPFSSPDAPNADSASAWLSALTDGEAHAVDRACAHWRDEPAARQTWHTYQLIGDVMRSKDLATAPARDAAFLAAVRVRLQAEPVVLAPAPLVSATAAKASAPRLPAWLLPAAAVAGFAAVAAVLVATRVGSPGLALTAPMLASAPSPMGPGLTATATATATAASQEAAPVLVNGLVLGQGVIRDARLDEFLRAHHSARAGMVVAAPGGTLRRVDINIPAAPVSPAAPAPAAER
jgi:sigma-E factor negative regulatory protein RseA